MPAPRPAARRPTLLQRIRGRAIGAYKPGAGPDAPRYSRPPLMSCREYELVLMLDPETPDERRDQIATEARRRIESGGSLKAEKVVGDAQARLRDPPAHRGRLPLLPLRDRGPGARRPRPQPEDHRRRPALPDLQGRPRLAGDRAAAAGLARQQRPAPRRPRGSRPRRRDDYEDRDAAPAPAPAAETPAPRRRSRRSRAPPRPRRPPRPPPAEAPAPEQPSEAEAPAAPDSGDTRPQ